MAKYTGQPEKLVTGGDYIGMSTHAAVTNESGRSLNVWRLRIEHTRQDGVSVLVLSGRLGGASSADLQKELDRIMEQGETRLVVDLENVDYISSSGLLAFDAISRRLTASHGCLVLCGTNDSVRIALALADLASPFLIEPDRQGAVRVASTL